MRGRPSRRSFLKQIGVGASVLPLAATLDAAGLAAAMAPQTGGCTAPGSLDTRLRYAAWRSSYAWRASIGV